MAPLDFCQNFSSKFGVVAFCMTRIEEFRKRKDQPKYDDDLEDEDDPITEDDLKIEDDTKIENVRSPIVDNPLPNVFPNSFSKSNGDHF